MIIWLNGAFGSGKTTLTEELHRRHGPQLFSLCSYPTRLHLGAQVVTSGQQPHHRSPVRRDTRTRSMNQLVRSAHCRIGSRHPLRVGAKSEAAVIGLLATCLGAACGTAAPAATPALPATITLATSAAAPAGTAALPSPLTGPAVTARARPSRCPQYPAATYGIDPNQVADTGGGAQLVTVVAPSAASRAGTFTAWTMTGSGCWSPVSFAGQPAQPFRAQTGYGGLLPYTQRVPGDWATPTGLFPFGTIVYGNSTVSPTSRYPYHHLVCGDWWDEQPGSPTYDTFQYVPCGIIPPYGDDSEALWTETQPYQHFIDIEMPSPPDHGAGIFLHDDMPEGYTEGCVALPHAELDAVLGWLNPDDRPHILITIG